MIKVNGLTIGPKADLQRADLRRADLRRADLRGADLRGATLRGANLEGADLWRANLQGANLQGADLRGATLRGANLQVAYLLGADLQGADLWRADLQGANLQGANLQGAYLCEAKNIPEYVSAMTTIVPEGELIVYKKARYDNIITLKVNVESKRSNATGRKCRFSDVTVLEISHGDEAISKHDKTFIYRVGQRIVVKDFDTDRWNECSAGIHAFLTRWEAENY